MRFTYFTILGLSVTFLAGCACTDPDFPNLGWDTAWFQRTDPHAFLLQEERRGGPCLFIGLNNPGLGYRKAIPGVPRRDPLVSVYQTCFVGGESQTDAAENRRFLQAAESFARRYNPEILAILRQHPECRIATHLAETGATSH